MIRELLNRKQWVLAYKLHARMTAERVEGANALLPELVMASRFMPAKSPEVDEIIARYADHVREPDDQLLKLLIARLVRQRGSMEAISHVFKSIKERKGESWTPGWEICSLMAQAEAQSGSIKSARRWFEQARDQIGNYKWAPSWQKEAIHVKLQIAYTRFLLGLSERHGRALLNVLKKMEYDQVLPERILINKLIAKAASHGRADGAFALYRAMKFSNPPIPGNKHTFYHLFSASTYAVRDRWLLEMGGRRLYRDMTRQHLSNTNHAPHKPSNVFDCFTLNAALRFFLRNRDYAAATVTMRTFPVCNIRPTQKTQEDVIESIVSRIKQEIMNASPEPLLWADRMLGEVIRLWHWDHEQRISIVEKLHRAVGHVTSSLTSTGVDLQLILALLRRAVLASESLWPGKDPELDKRTFAAVMEEASQDMLPRKGKHSPGRRDRKSVV